MASWASEVLLVVPKALRAGFFCIEITSKTKSLSFSLSVVHLEDEMNIKLEGREGGGGGLIPFPNL